MPTPDFPVFALRRASYQYPTGATALEDASFEIETAASVSVLGPNGCGKSTLLRLLDGLITAQSGSVLAWNEPLTDASLRNDDFAHRLRRRIGLVFQDADAMLFCPTVREEIAFGPRLLGLSASAVQARVDDLLMRCGLASLANRAPYELSGGEKRRVCVAAALSTSPEVLLLDEPTASLDPRTTDWLLDELIDRQAAGVTLVVATHDLTFAGEVTNRALVFDETHRLRRDGATTDILADSDFLRSVNLISGRASRHRHHRL